MNAQKYSFILISLLLLPITFAVSSINIGSSGSSSSTTNNFYNITNITGGNITGSGSAGNLSYWSNSTSLDNSILFYNSTLGYIGLNSIIPKYSFDLIGNLSVYGGIPPSIATTPGVSLGNTVVLFGAYGGNTTSTTTGTAGNGGGILIQGGYGGNVTAATSTSIGGNGGAITITSGLPGDTPVNTNGNARGGAGGAITITTSAGVTASLGANRFGGAGGTFSLFTGNGGAAGNGTGSGGNAGSVSISAGNGGASTTSSGAAGTGGSYTAQAGTGGSSNTGSAGAGGSVLFTAGNGGQSTGGGTQGNGGSIKFTAGNGALNTGNGLGGNIYFLPGSGNATGIGTIFLGTDGSTIRGNVMIGSTTIPNQKLQQDSGTATATYHKFTAGTTTGQTSTDGFDVGISATGEAQLRQYENLNMTIWTNNVGQITITNTGTLYFTNYTGVGNQYLCINSGGMLYRNTTCI